jgi:2'-hydroxyisoflavone reductase
MKKNILVIGGSYFIGRVFVLMLSRNSDYSIHLINRGNNPLRLPGVVEHVCDRNDTARMKKAIPPLDYNAVIDFCAEFPQQIAAVVEDFPGAIAQFIYISTCSVYKPSLDLPKFEDAPKHDAPLPGAAGDYSYNKWLLEIETRTVCESKGIPYTILRPAFVYGPYNYAPRESYFFDLILSNRAVPVPADSLALFQLVYVKDIAGILASCLGNEQVYRQAFNLSAEELVCYDRLMEVLEQVSGRQIKTERLSVDSIERDGVPLPFPLRQHELYSGSLIARTLDFRYTPFVEGMKKTFAFYQKYIYRGP